MGSDVEDAHLAVGVVGARRQLTVGGAVDAAGATQHVPGVRGPLIRVEPSIPGGVRARVTRPDTTGLFAPRAARREVPRSLVSAGFHSVPDDGARTTA